VRDFLILIRTLMNNSRKEIPHDESLGCLHYSALKEGINKEKKSRSVSLAFGEALSSRETFRIRRDDEAETPPFPITRDCESTERASEREKNQKSQAREGRR